MMVCNCNIQQLLTVFNWEYAGAHFGMFASLLQSFKVAVGSEITSIDLCPSRHRKIGPYCSAHPAKICSKRHKYAE